MMGRLKFGFVASLRMAFKFVMSGIINIVFVFVCFVVCV